MITTCTVCQARYQLDAERIPPRVIKVRCPSCSGVFTLDGTQVAREVPQEKPQEQPLAVTTGFQDPRSQPESAPDTPAVESAPAQPSAQVDPTPEPAAPAPTYHESPEPVTASGPEGDAPSESAAMETGMASEPEAQTEIETESETATAVMDKPAEASPRRRKSKEEMLARALVSDIMVYNRELYDTAKAENNLLKALGAEIKKSWELYKDKVGADVANDSDHFRDALNDILADGEKIF
jgi:predicted Zn finger-like uncharacterized protein